MDRRGALDENIDGAPRVRHLMPTLSTITVPVIKAFRHKGREMSVGESVTVSPVEASILARQKCVSLSRDYQTRDLTTEPKRKRGRPRKTYLRSDMQAEE